MYEVALSEWHKLPYEINDHCTEELLCLMLLKRKERLEREIEAARAARNGDKPQQKHLMLSNEDFFRRHGVKVKQHG